MPNIWRRFRDLSPGSPLLVGDVTTQHGDGTSTVTLIGGGVVRVLGESVAVGQRCYVRGGKIEGEAPSLTAETVEI